MPESTLFPRQGLWIWPLYSRSISCFYQTRKILYVHCTMYSYKSNAFPSVHQLFLSHISYFSSHISATFPLTYQLLFLSHISYFSSHISAAFPLTHRHQLVFSHPSDAFPLLEQLFYTKISRTLPFNYQLFFSLTTVIYLSLLRIQQKIISYIEHQMTHCSHSSYFTVQYLYISWQWSIILNQHILQDKIYLTQYHGSTHPRTRREIFSNAC
jgi:hypothetical protein